MQIKKIVPSGPEFMREALIVIGGAALAVLIVRLLPANVKKYFDINAAIKGDS